MSDWIDELENSEDDKTYAQIVISKIYKTVQMKEHGWAEAWAWLQGVLDDNAYTEEHSGPLSATDSKKLTEKRVKRDE